MALLPAWLTEAAAADHRLGGDTGSLRWGARFAICFEEHAGVGEERYQPETIEVARDAGVMITFIDGTWRRSIC